MIASPQKSIGTMSRASAAIRRKPRNGAGSGKLFNTRRLSTRVEPTLHTFFNI
jgi:hypothetical protein